MIYLYYRQKYFDPHTVTIPIEIVDWDPPSSPVEMHKFLFQLSPLSIKILKTTKQYDLWIKK